MKRSQVLFLVSLILSAAFVNAAPYYNSDHFDPGNSNGNNSGPNSGNGNGNNVRSNSGLNNGNNSGPNSGNFNGNGGGYNSGNGNGNNSGSFSGNGNGNGGYPIDCDDNGSNYGPHGYPSAQPAAPVRSNDEGYVPSERHEPNWNEPGYINPVPIVYPGGYYHPAGTAAHAIVTSTTGPVVGSTVPPVAVAGTVPVAYNTAHEVNC